VGPWRHAAQRLRRDRSALVFGALLAALLLACLGAPLWGDHVAGTGPISTTLLPPGVEPPFGPRVNTQTRPATSAINDVVVS